LVWTTTPWTIPANIAIAVDADISYSQVEAKDGQRYWLAEELVGKIFKSKEHKKIKTVKGADLAGLKYQGAFDHLPSVKKAALESLEKFHTVIVTDKQLMLYRLMKVPVWFIQQCRQEKRILNWGKNMASDDSGY